MRGHVLAPGSRTWQLQPCGSGFGVKDRRNGLWNVPQCLKKVADAVSGVSLNGGLVERPLCEAVKLKPGLPWRTQDIRDARDMR